MPIEHRQISLLGHELLEAVEAYRRVAPELLPAGKVQSVSVHGDLPSGPNLKVAINTDDGATTQTIKVHLHRASALELLIRYCLQAGIPLPRGATKRAAVQDGLLTLVIDRSLCPVPERVKARVAESATE